nr:MAG TPA: hypothetical protein [Bacteriophage sp.]
MGKFNEYSQKATPADNDTLMIYDATSKANKLSPFSGIWNWIVGKLTNAVISNLETQNKSVVGALNELNSNRLTDSTKLLETPTEYIENISDSDYTSCFRNGKIVTLVLNIKVLKPLSSFNTYLTLPKQYIPSSVMFVSVMALDTGIRIGTSGEVMPCADIGVGAYIQTAISYVIK